MNNIRQALEAGCRWIQLRFKNASDNELTEVAHEVKKICTFSGAVFIMNDHPGIAKEVSADGVHLGLTDMSITEAKKIVGNDKIIGGTANTLKDVLQRVDEECNYIGLGPLRFTTTKDALSPILGLEGYVKIMKEMEAKGISIPVYAIGGIELHDLPALIQTGVYGIAVSGMITHHPDKKILLDQLNAILI